MIYVKHTGPAPLKGRPEDAGWDLAVTGGPYVFEPFEARALSTGVFLELPAGYCALAHPRSSAVLQGWHCAGLIDPDYRGEVKCLVTNLNQVRRIVHPGQRLLQLIILPVAQARMVAVEALSESGRGPNGFGSSGR